MDLLKKTKELCKLYNIHPARSKGQNFLIKEEVYDKIIEAAELVSDDVVLEVGPGLGFLTAKLAKRVSRVIAVELDDKLAEILRTGLRAQGVDNVEVVNGNILDAVITNYKLQITNYESISNFEFRSFKVVANLPYNITSVFLRKFLSAEQKPELMVLMLQKEVAERITAKPGEMSLLAVSVQFYAEPKIIQYAPADNFWPKPEVDSAIVKIRIKPQSVIARSNSDEAIFNSSRKIRPIIDRHGLRPRDDKTERDFFRLVKIGFSAKRKMLKNNLAAGYRVKQEVAENWLKRAGLGGKIRAQELAVDDWIGLFGKIEGNML